MKLLIQTKNSGLFLRSIREQLSTVREWFVGTPERALEQAYQAALMIKTMEDEHFGSNKIYPDSALHSESVIACLEADLEKYLNIAKIRVAEFRMSRSVLEKSDSKLLVKLGFIDKVISKYTLQQDIALASTSNSNLLNKEPYEFKETGDLDSQISRKKGVLPRSIGKTVNRIKTELNSNSEQEVITNFRRSNKKTKTAIKFVILMILIPILSQQLSKNILIYPIIVKMRNLDISSIFVNHEMKEQALKELENFEEELRFYSLINKTLQLPEEGIKKQVQHKATEIVEEFWKKSNSAISNVFADLLALVAFSWFMVTSKREIAVLKSFMDDVAYGLSDSAKAFIIILFTDIFVGYHSTHGWEILLEGLASHLGITASRSIIFLFIATFPVILNTVFKYWIFRYLSRISPSAVATLKNMNE